jgi:abortive infection bacteriophage resistance protein
MYKVLPHSLQSKVCKNFTYINPHHMEQFLSVLTKFRNVCAHGECLFTYRTQDSISDLPLHEKLAIPKSGFQYQYGKNDLFAVVITFRYLIPSKDYLTFKKKLATLINHIFDNLVHIDNTELLNHMGFPENWNKITRYQLTP